MSNERRIAAYMNLHGYTREQAVAKIKQNPAPRSTAPKAAKKGMSKKTYVNRPSQAGEQRAPSGRLKARRKTNLETPKGVYPNPLPPELKNAAQFYRHEIRKKNIEVGTKFVNRGDTLTIVKITPVWVWATFDKWNKPKQNPLKPGITARKAGPKSASRKMLSVDYAKAKDGPWTIAGVFPNRQLATDYARAMADKNDSLYWRVATL